MSNERVIKFRVWHPVFGMMKPWTLKEKTEWTEKKGERVIDVRWDDGVIFMQFTGLHDKNGVEIYDQDRVKRRVDLVEGKDYMDYNCDVRWNGWCFGLFIHDKQVWGLDPITARETEVIGNIYQLNK